MQARGLEEIDMTKSKVELVLRVAGAIGNVTTILTRRVAALGGNYTEALVRLGTGEKQYGAEYARLAALYAGVSNGFVAPEDGRIHVLLGITVAESSEWSSAIDASFPNTPSDCDVREVADLYPAKKGVKAVEREVILVNFGITIANTDPVLAWGKEYKLRPASPRTVFALGKWKPQLHTELEQDTLGVISLEECSLSGYRHMPYGWWYGDERKVNLGWSDSSFGDYCWFAFVRE